MAAKVDWPGLEVVLFDLGNTLIPFGPAEVAAQNRRLEAALVRLYGSVDLARLEEVRRRQIVAPYARGFRENDLRETCAEIARQSACREPDGAEIESLMAVRRAAFQETVRLPAGVRDLLGRLRRRYRLGLVSNFPCGESIRIALQRTALAPLFETVVVSADVGLVKPHPRPFEVALAALGAPPAAGVHVGDNWLADIQGARRLGLRAVHTIEYAPYETFAPQPGDLPADAVIGRLAELEELLA